MFSSRLLTCLLVNFALTWSLAQGKCAEGETMQCADGSAVDKEAKPPCKTGKPQCCKDKVCKDAPAPEKGADANAGGTTGKDKAGGGTTGKDKAGGGTTGKDKAGGGTTGKDKAGGGTTGKQAGGSTTGKQAGGGTTGKQAGGGNKTAPTKEKAKGGEGKNSCPANTTFECKDGSAPDLKKKPPCSTKEDIPKCCKDGNCTKAPGGGSTKPVETGKPCDRKTIESAVKKCVGDVKGDTEDAKAKGKATCLATFEKAMKDQCGVTVKAADAAKLQKDEARKALAACQMKAKDAAAKKACDTQYEEKTGEKKVSSGDATKDAVKDKLEANKGAKDALADGMKACTKTKEVCMEEMRAQMANMKGKNITKDEMKVELEKAGKGAAGAKIKECVSKAVDDAAKKKCATGADAKAAYAAASGKNVSEIRDSDMKQAGKDQARADVKDKVDACIEAAGTNATMKKMCFKGDDLKRAIGNAEGKNSGDVTDSKVQSYIATENKKEQLSVIKDCDKKADAKKCIEVMKEMKAKQSGKNASKITDDDLRKDIKEALAGSVADQMKACMEGAGKNETKVAACKTAIKDAIKEASLDGKAPDKTQVQKVLNEAAQKSAKDVMESCELTRDECMELVKEKAAAAKGNSKGKAGISTREAESMVKAGAQNAAKDSAKACMEARKDNADAVCDDPLDKYLATKNQTKPSTKAGEKTLKGKVLEGVAKGVQKDSLKVCASKATKEEVKACMDSFEAENAEVTKALYGNSTGDSKEAKKAAAQKKKAKAEAAIEYLGEELDACMQAATNATEKNACKAAMSAARQRLGSNETDEAVQKKYNAKKIAEAASVCQAADRKECLQDAKKDFEANGNKGREFEQQKRMGEVKAAADAWAACSQADGETFTDAECDEQAKIEFTTVSGSDGSQWVAQVLPAVQKLAKGIIAGEDVVLKKKEQLKVDTDTDGTECKDADADKVVTVMKAANTTPPIGDVKKMGCRLTDGKASYSTIAKTKGLTDEQSEAAADKLAENLGKSGALADRRLLAGRRLVAVTSVGAAPDTELCASGDASCGQTDSFESTTGTTGTTGGSSTTGTTGGSSTTGTTGTTGGSSTTGTTGVTPAAKALVITGEVGLTVADADSFLVDQNAKDAVQAGIADTVGVAKEQVVVVFTKKERRLSEERHLAGTSIKVAYTITLPASAGSAVHAAARAKANAATTETLNTAISAKVTAAKGKDYTVTVASKSKPALTGGDPVTPAGTSSSAAIKAGVAFLMLAFSV